MKQNLQIPAWGLWVMIAALAGFIALAVYVVKRNGGVKRSFFSSPYVVWMVLFTIIPCLLVAYYAFTDGSGKLTLDNFINFWDSNHSANQMYAELGEEYAFLIKRGSVNIDVLLYSLWMALLCTAISLFLGYPAAYIMADKELKIGTTIVVLFIIPMWMNFLLRTVAWVTLLEDNGLINTLLTALGFPRTQLLYNNQAVLLGMVYNFLPFMVFPIYTSLSKMDTKLEEAAQDLGANRFHTFTRVKLPLSLPGVISGITMVFMPSVTTFALPKLLGGSNTMMFGDLIESMFLTQNDWGVGSALSLVMMVLILISLGILRKADPEGEGGGIV